MDTRKGAGPPEGGGRHERGCDRKTGDTLPAPAPPVNPKAADRRTVGRAVPAPYFKVPEFLLRHPGLTLADALLWAILARDEPPAGDFVPHEVRDLAGKLRRSMRAVQSSLAKLTTAGLLELRKSPGENSTYRVHIPAELDTYANFAGVTPAKSAGDLCKKREGTSAKSAADPCKLCGATDVQSPCTSTGGGHDSPPTARGPENGNGRHQGETDPADALLALFKEARGGKALSPAQAARFREALAESLDAGATGAMNAAEIRRADYGTDPWDPPNVAREKARRLLASYQAAAHMPKPRTSVAQILSDLNFARRKRAQNPRPDRGDEGAALWQAQVEWADVHAEGLAEAAGMPEPAEVEARS